MAPRHLSILRCLAMGRRENGPYHSLGDWARPHDMYSNGGMVEGNGRYHARASDCAIHQSKPLLFNFRKSRSNTERGRLRISKAATRQSGFARFLNFANEDALSRQMDAA
jgi:hypothetical protein